MIQLKDKLSCYDANGDMITIDTIIIISVNVHSKEKFEDSKEIRSHNSKENIELNYQEKSDRTSNDLQNKTQKTKGQTTRTKLKTKTQKTKGQRTRTTLKTKTQKTKGQRTRTTLKTKNTEN
jgi:hypothetical protein